MGVAERLNADTKAQLAEERARQYGHALAAVLIQAGGTIRLRPSELAMVDSEMFIRSEVDPETGDQVLSLHYDEAADAS